MHIHMYKYAYLTIFLFKALAFFEVLCLHEDDSRHNQRYLKQVAVLSQEIYVIFVCV